VGGACINCLFCDILENINIIGRKDASFWGTNPRLSTVELLAKIPDDKKDN